MLASGSSDVQRRRAALEELCGAYWYPLYAYTRRSGRSHEDAADLVQQFLAMLLERDDLKKADPERGRFRSFLLTSLRHFASNQLARERALKRGGGRVALTFDAHDADARFAREPEDPRTPERAFDRAWAEDVLARALARLRAEQTAIGRAAHFEALFPALTAQDDAPSHAVVARSLDMTENAAKVALHRLRKRLGELVRDEVAGTLDDPAEIESEVRCLFDALSGA